MHASSSNIINFHVTVTFPIIRCIIDRCSSSLSLCLSILYFLSFIKFWKLCFYLSVQASSLNLATIQPMAGINPVMQCLSSSPVACQLVSILKVSCAYAIGLGPRKQTNKRVGLKRYIFGCRFERAIVISLTIQPKLAVSRLPVYNPLTLMMYLVRFCPAFFFNVQCWKAGECVAFNNCLSKAMLWAGRYVHHLIKTLRDSSILLLLSLCSGKILRARTTFESSSYIPSQKFRFLMAYSLYLFIFTYLSLCQVEHNVIFGYEHSLLCRSFCFEVYPSVLGLVQFRQTW